MSFLREANRDEAVRCEENARGFLLGRDYVNALRFVDRAIRLCPSESAALLREEIVRAQRGRWLPRWMRIHPSYYVPLVVLGFVLVAVLCGKYFRMDMSGFEGLPGDFAYHTEGVSVYFPFMSSVIVSVILNIAINFLRA